MAPDTLDLDLVVRRLAGDGKARVSADAVAVWLLGLDGSELALHAALGFAEEREHVERAEILLAVTQTLASTSDLPAALGEIAHRTAAALGAECCEIHVADAPAPSPSAVPEGGAELVVPIGREYAAIGSLRLVRRDGGEWAPTIVELATAIAGQIALAAENARLVRQAEAHAGELAALYDVTATLTSTLE